MSDKPIPVTLATLPSFDEYQQLLQQIWQTGQLTNNGEMVRILSERLRTWLETPYLQLLANGTLALQLAIRALDLQGEVITTPYSYVATANAILWEGCEPVFVDIDPQSFCIAPDAIEAAITGRTTAILATHVYGYPCDVIRIQEIAEHHGLKVIYDAAHAFGVRLNGASLLNYGDCSTLSLHATKIFHTAEGGAVACHDDDLAQKIFLMSKFGHIGEDEYLTLGINAKMSELHAAMGIALIPQIQEIIEARRQRSEWYDELLAGTALQRPQAPANLEYNYAYYPVIFRTHEAMMTVRQFLHDHNIHPRRYFHPSLNVLPFLNEAWRRPCPVSESLSQRVLCLPLYAELRREDIERIVQSIKHALKT